MILALPVWTAWAQMPCSLNIRGIVLDVTDSARLSGVEIFIEKGHIRDHAKSNGSFLLSEVCPGMQLLEFEKSGYEHIHIELSIQKDTFIYIWMFPKARLSDTIVLYHYSEEGKTLAEKSRSADIKAGSNLAEATAQIPGISLMQGGKNQAKPMLRGMYGLRLPIIAGNFRLEGQQWGNDHNPEADPNSFEQLIVLRDANALLYAHDGHFGTIRLMNAPDVHAGESSLDQTLSYSSNGNQVASKTKFVRQTEEGSPIFYGSASLRKAGNYSIPGLIIDNTGLEEYSLSGGVKKMNSDGFGELTVNAYRFEGGIFTGARAGNVNDLLSAIHRSSPVSSNHFTYTIDAPRQVSGHVDIQYQNLKNRGRNYRHWFTDLQYDQRREFDFHRNSQLRFPQLDLYLLVPSIKYELGKRFQNNTIVKWGGAASLHEHQYGGFYFLPDFTGYTGGTFTEISRQLKQTHISFSLRGDAKGLNSQVRENGKLSSEKRNFINYSSALSLRKRIHKKSNTNSTLLSFNASRTWRAPWVNELYSSGVHHGAASYEKGSRNLLPEICYRSEGIADFSDRKWQAFVSPYLAYIQGFINLSPMSTPIVTVRGVFPGFEYTQGNLFMYGIDAGIDLDLTKHLQWHCDFNYIYQQYSKSKRYPAFIPPARIKQKLNFNHSKLNAALCFEYTFEQKQFTANSDFLPPPGAFGLWSLKLSGKSPDSRLGLEINNLFNITYRSYLDRFRYFMPMPGRNVSLSWHHHIHHHTKKHSKPN